MTRFFIDPSKIGHKTIYLNNEDITHIRSLRLRPSEFFIVCDGNGLDYICKLSENKKNAVAEIIDKRVSVGEPVVKCSVYIAYAKGDRLDYAVQKSVELGAYEIILYPSARCISKPVDTYKKAARMQRIALETAKQCDRGRVPQVFSVNTYDEAITLAGQADLPLFFYEFEDELSLKTVLEHRANESESPNSISIVIGPEGGFEPHEAEYAKGKGLIVTSLGSRILRCETAPVAALAAIMFFFGEM